MGKWHELKTWPSYFQAVLDGRKTFEARKNDRDFRVGDNLKLREWIPDAGRYSGREVEVHVSYMLEGGSFGIEAGHCILAFNGVNVFRTVAPTPSPGTEGGGT